MSCKICTGSLILGNPRKHSSPLSLIFYPPTRPYHTKSHDSPPSIQVLTSEYLAHSSTLPPPPYIPMHHFGNIQLNHLTPDAEPPSPPTSEYSPHPLTLAHHILDQHVHDQQVALHPSESIRIVSDQGYTPNRESEQVLDHHIIDQHVADQQRSRATPHTPSTPSHTPLTLPPLPPTPESTNTTESRIIDQHLHDQQVLAQRALQTSSAQPTSAQSTRAPPSHPSSIPSHTPLTLPPLSPTPESANHVTESRIIDQHLHDQQVLAQRALQTSNAQSTNPQSTNAQSTNAQSTSAKSTHEKSISHKPTLDHLPPSKTSQNHPPPALSNPPGPPRSPKKEKQNKYAPNGHGKSKQHTFAQKPHFSHPHPPTPHSPSTKQTNIKFNQPLRKSHSPPHTRGPNYLNGPNHTNGPNHPNGPNFPNSPNSPNGPNDVHGPSHNTLRGPNNLHGPNNFNGASLSHDPSLLPHPPLSSDPSLSSPLLSSDPSPQFPSDPSSPPPPSSDPSLSSAEYPAYDPAYDPAHDPAYAYYYDPAYASYFYAAYQQSLPDPTSDPSPLSPPASDSSPSLPSPPSSSPSSESSSLATSPPVPSFPARPRTNKKSPKKAQRDVDTPAYLSLPPKIKTLQAFNEKIETAVRGRFLRPCMDLYAQMRTHGIAPDLTTFHLLISAHVRTPAALHANQLFTELLACELVPTRETYNLLYAANETQPAYCDMIYAHMRAAGIAPDADTVRKLIVAHLRNTPDEAQTLRRTNELLWDLCVALNPPSSSDLPSAPLSSSSLASSDPLPPSLPPSSATLLSSSDSDPPSPSSHLISNSSESPTPTTPILTFPPSSLPLLTDIFNKVLGAVPARAMPQVYAAMRTHGIPPDSVTFTTLLRESPAQGTDACAHEDAILEEMREHGLAMDVVTYNTLITRATHRKDVARCKDLYRVMNAQDLEPNLVTYKALTLFMAKMGEHEFCWEVLRDMKNRGWS